MAAVALVCLVLVALAADARAQQLFRTSLFPEQLQQQQLQLVQRNLQDELQAVQRRWQLTQNPGVRNALQQQQAGLLIRLQDIQGQQQDLQRRLQEQLSGQVGPQIQPQFEQIQVPVQVQVSVPVPLQATRIVVTERDQGSAPACRTLSGVAGACRPLVQCLTLYTEVPELRRQPCRLLGNELGVCCPLRKQTAVAPAGSSGVLRPPPPPPVAIPPITPQQLDAAASAALERVRQRLEFLAALFSGRVFVQEGTPAAWHQEFFQTTPETLEQGVQAQKNVEATVGLVEEFKLTAQQGTFALPSFSVLNTVIADTCPPRASCDAGAKYRTADGSCNNLANERWGRAGTALQRILPPKYDDGVNAPRSRDANGAPLLSSRIISTEFATEADRPSSNYTLMVMQWGQFLDHDLTHTPINRGQSGSGITCCENGGLIAPEKRHPDCFPIQISANDSVFAKFREQCMEFVRSLPAPRPECNFGPREQMNQVTGYIDGSNIYGSSLAAQRDLREFSGGRLKVQSVRGRPFLPQNREECTNDDNSQQACFKAGDTRVNEQVDLAVMHTVWLREHNRVAGELSRLNPQWSDEALFQEARRIVVAELQHITYNEFLPIVLGQEYMDRFQLNPQDRGYSRLYDSSLNAGITNVFATAAFRFGHSLIQSHLQGVSMFGTLRENLVLHEHQFSPFTLYNDGALDNFVRGLSTQPSQRVDRFFTKEITDHLFQADLDFGLDLVALNLQRGRDHGLPPYNDWREVCGLPRAESWENLQDVMDGESISILRRLYSSVNEVDLFVAGIAERPVPGAILGKTFVCLVGDQFARLRRGDRFFYEEGSQPSSFTEAQLENIRKTSLSRILCDNSNDIVQMQPLSFIQASLLNQRVACASESIPRMDLSAWKNERVQI